MILSLLILGQNPQFKPVSEWKTCEVSTYSQRFHGRTTASGERYDHYGISTAVIRKRGSTRPLYKFGTWVELKTSTGRTMYVRINDTGSYRPSRPVDAWFDLSGGAWKTLYPNTDPSRYVIRYRVVEKVEQN
jgi:rare lipoprotein A